jgi:aspartate-semialdehyde dehydrogenase
MGKALKLAVIGAGEPLGEALLQVLAAGDLEVETCWPIVLDEDDATSVEFAGKDLACLELADLDWSSVDVVVVASPRVKLQELSALAEENGVPLFGPQALLGAGPGRPLLPYAQADAPALALSRVLAPLQAALGLASVHVFIGLPMAALGNKGLTELARQTQSLFAMQPLETEVLPVRMAFNVLPVSAHAGLEREAAVVNQLRALLMSPDLAVQASMVWMPIFHGGVASLQVRTQQPTTLRALRQLWSGTAGLTVMDEPLPGGVPTPATEAVDSEDVFVGRLEVDTSDPSRLSCWLCFDHPRIEAVRIAESLTQWQAQSSRIN